MPTTTLPPLESPSKTPIAAGLLGITYGRLISLLRSGRLAPPRRDSSGDYLWTEADLQRAREAMKIDRRRKEVRRAD